MSGNTAGRTGTNASSTDSGQGTDPLSDVFVAAPSGTGPAGGPDKHVEAPEGSAHLSIRRSSRVASSRSRSTLQITISNNSIQDIVVAPPGIKQKPGYVYQVLSPTAEEPGHSATPAGPAGNASGLRDTAIPQMAPMVGTPNLVNRKRSATSAASGSAHQAPMVRHLASAADFSPTHFDELASEDHISMLKPLQPPPAPPSLNLQPDPLSPMRVESRPETAPQQPATPFSSPVSQNPLNQDKPPMIIQTPSPSRKHSASFRTWDSNAAWAAAQGLLPITASFSAPGFVPAHIVGGVTYSIHSPQECQPTVLRSVVGQQLLTEYEGTRTHGQGQQQSLQHSVRAYHTNYCAYTDLRIVSPSGATAYSCRYSNATRRTPVCKSTYASCKGNFGQATSNINLNQCILYFTDTQTRSRSPICPLT